MDFIELRNQVRNDLHTILPLILGEHGSILLQSQQLVEGVGPFASEDERQDLADLAVRLEICLHTSAMAAAMDLQCHLLDLLKH